MPSCTKKTATSRAAGLFSALLLLFWIGGCGTGGVEDPYVSTLNRPVAIAIAVVDWTPTPAYRELAAEVPDLWEQCLGLEQRAFAFVANSGGDSVARIDLCTGEVVNSHIKGNPFVVSHISVGSFPVDVAASLDHGNSRIFVANGGENSLSVIVTETARTLQDKVILSSRPTHLAVVPSEDTPEGDVYVTLPYLGALARVVKRVSDERERWMEVGFAQLKTDITPDPVPAGMAAAPNGKTLYVADMNADHFHIVDLEHPEYPARTRFVNGPQRSCSVSPDGRFLYLTKLDRSRIAVYDLQYDRYVDTNEELPSHRNSPPPSAQFDYDISLESVPQTVLFADVVKTFEIEEPDGDTDETDAETAADGDLIPDGDADNDAESSEDAEDAGNMEESDTSSRSSGLPVLFQEADGDADGMETESESESDNAETFEPKELYAYSIGQDGIIQVIDVHRDMHELYDTYPDTSAELRLLSENELETDNGMCIADIDARVDKGRTPNGLWELSYAGVVPGSDVTYSGRFDFDRNRFYDDNLDFASLPEILPRPLSSDPDNPYPLSGDWLEIRTGTMAPPPDSLGCVREVTDDEGNTTLVKPDVVRLEITKVTPDYLEFDRAGYLLENCYNSAVEYQIRANGNYLVNMTRLDTFGNRLGSPVYQGRAVNVDFRQGDVVSGAEQFEQLKFSEDDWEDYVCLIERTDEEGNETNEYRFTKDLLLSEDEEPVKGIRCRNKWNDADPYQISFENDYVSFAICQDEQNTDIRAKREGSFIYSFRTFSGINEIQESYETADDTEVYDRRVGNVLEDAAILNLYEDFPRLYVVDSSAESIYVIDLKTDFIINQIL